MRIGVLGLGVWGFCLARHLALNGHEVIGWARDEELCTHLRNGNDHPHLGRSLRGLSIRLTSDMSQLFDQIDCLVEAVTTSGLRKVMEQTLRYHYSPEKIPLVLTSKGIEQKTHLLPSQISASIFTTPSSSYIAVLSGPSFAQEVAKGLPTAVVCGSVHMKTSQLVSTLFSNNIFRVYPNEDIIGVSLGGALKNVIAIACGIADGLDLGTGAKASLVTRGLHEMVKLAITIGASPNTIYGLSGLGDLYLTCSSPLSRNFRFGKHISEGLSQKDAEEHIGTVVEGAATAQSAFELSARHGISMPITQAVYDVIYKKLPPQEAVRQLMQRVVKEERL